MIRSRFLFGLLLITIMIHNLLMVQGEDAAVITAANIHRLKSVQQIDFTDLTTDAGEIINGWFALSPDARHLALVNRDHEVILLRDDGTLVARYPVEDKDGQPTTMVDMAFDPLGTMLASVHLAAGQYVVATYRLPTEELTITTVNRPDFPLRIWAENNAIWLETEPADYTMTRYVTQFGSEETIPSGPENDMDAYLRVGRIDAPYAITVTQSLRLQRWDLPTGAVTAQADIAALPGVGALSEDGRFFAWRDNESTGLYVLDIEQNLDRQVTDLEGAYLPFMTLTPDADVIVAVNPNNEPLVLAWRTATGDRVDLGAYRSCLRPPDYVRLSTDGTTLVIGCDQGLDLWRVR
jgi:hypothetical protein